MTRLKFDGPEHHGLLLGLRRDCNSLICDVCLYVFLIEQLTSVGGIFLDDAVEAGGFSVKTSFINAGYPDGF